MDEMKTWFVEYELTGQLAINDLHMITNIDFGTGVLSSYSTTGVILNNRLEAPDLPTALARAAEWAGRMLGPHVSRGLLEPTTLHVTSREDAFYRS